MAHNAWTAPGVESSVAAVPDDTEGMEASELLSRTEEFRAMLCEAHARGLTPDEQEDLDELIRAMRRLLDEPIPIRSRPT